jgi:hypothetical protein
VFLAISVLAWVGFRMARRLADEPYIDFRAFHEAAVAVTNGEDVYRVGLRMYIYPPMLAAWMSPLASLPVRAAAWIWFALAAGVTLASLRAWWVLLADRFRLSPASFWPAAGLALLAWVEQVRRECETGQCDWLLLGAVTFAAAAVPRYPVVAGLLLGFAVNVKYLPLLFVAWLAARRRWVAAGAALGGTVLWALLPATVYGWDRNLDYLGRATAGLGKLVGVHADGQPGMVFPLEYGYSVSVPSGAARLGQRLGVGRRLVAPVVGLTALVVAAAVVRLYRRHGWALARRGVAEAPGLDLLEWAGVLTVMLAFSPQAQNRHLFLLLPVVLLGTGLLVNRIQVPRAALALAAGVLGTALLGDAGAAEGGALNWGAIGGGGIAILAAYLLLLDAGLRRLRDLRDSEAAPRRIEGHETARCADPRRSWRPSPCRRAGGVCISLGVRA